MMYLFNWDEITGNIGVRLLFFIEHDLNIDLGDNAKIEKFDDSNTIKISSPKNTLLFKLNDEKTGVTLKINGVKTDKFIARTEKGKLNIYKINEVPPPFRIYFSKTISTGIPAFILVYIFYLIAFNVPVIYMIDIGSKGDTDPGSDAYIRDLTAQGRISESMSLEDDNFRIMKGSPVYFYITPTNSISNHTNVTVELKFRGDSDLDIGVYKDYAWKPLYIKNLENFTPVKQFGDVVIYTKDNSRNYTDYNTINEWISGNIPRDSTIGLYDYEVDPSILINRNLTYANAITEINQTFRGTHSFLIYINNSLNLTIFKQDLNSYEGEDVYSVELYDMEGNLIFEDIVEDDGIIDNSSRIMPPQFKAFFRDGIIEGVYELRLVNIKGENKDADSTIKRIQINTDKIVTKGDILPLNPGTLFFEIKRNTTLKFNAWHTNAVQNISIHGGLDKEIVINKSLLGKIVSDELPKGRYNMDIKGDLYISGTNFAFTERSLFQTYKYMINNENNEWIIISNYEVEKHSDGWVTTRKIFKGSDLKLYNNETIVFGLRNKKDSEVMLNEFKVTLIPR